MIKYTEINVGDWVRVNDVEYPMPLMVNEIVRLGGQYYLRLGRDDDATIFLECVIEKVLPVPLTDAILLKNNFDKVDEETFMYYDDQMRNVMICTHSSLEDPLPIADIACGITTISRVPVPHVHILQRELKDKVHLDIRL